MVKELEINVPDIGGSTQVDVIELLVKEGDRIAIDTPLITLESDKASMEIPSPKAGVVTKIHVRIGDKVSEGDKILSVQAEETADTPAPEAKAAASTEEKVAEKPATVQETTAKSQLLEVTIPDIGGATGVDVIDILVKPGMEIQKDQSLITLEGDKATMDIPSPYAGVVKAIKLQLGDKVAQGTPILSMDAVIAGEPPVEQKTPAAEKIEPVAISEQPKTPPVVAVAETTGMVFAGPAVRRMAREFGINLTLVQGSARKARITKEDLQAYVKARLSNAADRGGFSLPTAPVIDFSKFGEIETKPLNKIKKLTGVNVHRSWITIPHVTQFDEADISDLESFRKSESDAASNAGYKLTILAFVCSVVSKALHTFPQFNASLDASGEQLIYKKYCNIGIAVETPNGLVVPVIKNVDRLTVVDIAIEMGRLSTKAREKGLMPADMSGGCFTISSLGGIGGTAFTPIVNSPEVAILGLSRAMMKPVYIDGTFLPRLMLPLSLSYDHRVIDGAEAARFTRFICDNLSDIRRVLL